MTWGTVMYHCIKTFLSIMCNAFADFDIVEF